MTAIERQGLKATGPPFAYYPATPTTVVTLEAGFPASDAVDPEGRVDAFELPGGTAVTTTHVGPYDTMEETYERMRTWMADHGYEPSPGMWEVYLTDPEDEPDPARWRTRIVWPVKSGPVGRHPNGNDPAATLGKLHASDCPCSSVRIERRVSTPWAAGSNPAGGAMVERSPRLVRPGPARGSARRTGSTPPRPRRPPRRRCARASRR